MNGYRTRAFPRRLDADAQVVARLLKPTPYDSPRTLGSQRRPVPLTVQGESLAIPYRIYSEPPDAEEISRLEGKQQLLVAALLTRHNNGFVRQRAAATLAGSAEPWVPPYIIQLLGEYVIEIVKEVGTQLVPALRDDEAVRATYMAFASENPVFMELTKQRAVSYWTCYYRYATGDHRDSPAVGLLRTITELSPPTQRHTATGPRRTG